MHHAIVIPCLNEENALASTCASLGFGTDERDAPTDTLLVLVDNGSTDDTLNVMERVRASSPPGGVLIVEERERGYVPPRHAGVVATARWAKDLHIPEEEVFVMQADADTYYQADYLDAMRCTSEQSGSNVLVEGCSLTSPEFDCQFPAYGELCREADDSIRSVFVDSENDVIVDDKVVGYRLCDYFSWGGHLREYMTSGEEVDAETTRLYIRARLQGARRVRAEAATAYPSRRKVVENPCLYFVTAGFPREQSWRDAWIRMYDGPNTLVEFDQSHLGHWLTTIVLVRQCHSFAFFTLLPACVQKLRGRDQTTQPPQIEEMMRRRLGGLTRESVACNTAPLFERVLTFLDEESECVRAILRNATQRR